MEEEAEEEQDGSGTKKTGNPTAAAKGKCNLPTTPLSTTAFEANNKGTRRSSLPILTLEEERSMRRAEQDAKDRELAERLRGIEMESAKRNHSIKATKKALLVNTRRHSERRVTQLKEDTKKSMQLDSKDSKELLGRLAETFRTLELNSNASELEQWCDSCQCLHTVDVVKLDEEEKEKFFEENSATI